MPKLLTAYVQRDEKRDRWMARLTYLADNGKQKDIKRWRANKADAKALLDKLKEDIKTHGLEILNGEKMTFSKIAEVYSQKVLPSLQSRDNLERRMVNLIQVFGRYKIQAITCDMIEDYRDRRLQTPTYRYPDKQITLVTVNRELQLLRSVFNYAKRRDWLIKSPFEKAKGLIRLNDEEPRDRILSHDEEIRLLAALAQPARRHVIPIVIAAIETAMRRNELMQIKWSHVDLMRGVINIPKEISKTHKARTVPINTHLRATLLKLQEQGLPDIDPRVFGYIGDFKKAWLAAVREAKIEDFRFHDLRHTATTRMIQSGMPPMIIRKITGHTQDKTFARYVNVDSAIAQEAAQTMDRWRAQQESKNTQSIPSSTPSTAAAA